MCSEASITTHPAHTKKFTTGTDLSLRCRCRSSSTGTVRWIKNGVTFSPANGHVAMDHKKLNINSTTFADSGNYTCYVTIDKLGTAKSEKLEIWGKYKKKCLKNKRLSSFYNFACGFCIVNKMDWIEKKNGIVMFCTYLFVLVNNVSNFSVVIFIPFSSCSGQCTSNNRASACELTRRQGTDNVLGLPGNWYTNPSHILVLCWPSMVPTC